MTQAYDVMKICSFHKRKFTYSDVMISKSLYFSCQIESCRNAAEFYGINLTIEITGVEL